MSLPHAKLVARLKSISAVTALVGSKVFPILAPQGTQYPCVVYQVIGNSPETTLDGSTTTFTMRVRVSCLSLTTAGEQGYKGAWDLAAAIIGDCDSTPTGLNGWVDSDGLIWHLEDCFDEIGDIMYGRDQMEAFVVNQVYLVEYGV